MKDVPFGADAIAATVYWGSPQEDVMMRQFAEIASYAHDLGFPVVQFAYPRGPYINEKYGKKEDYRVVMYGARAAVEGGADGITAVNTMGPGMMINIETRQPVLDFKVGGVSGPALRPIAVRCVYDIYIAMQKFERQVPIIGLGGISTGRHAIESMMASEESTPTSAISRVPGMHIYSLSACLSAVVQGLKRLKKTNKKRIFLLKE